MSGPVLVIDAYGFVFRAYHVQPSLISPNGLDVGALYGFASMLIKILGEFKSDNVLVVFDGKGKNFRHAIYSEYKATRPPIDEALRLQLPLVRMVPTVLGVQTREVEGVEADDIIASIVHQLSAKGIESTIVSSDKDLMQLVGQYTSMYDPSKSKFINENEVREKFGVLPNRVRDVLALIGDKSDNIPGVPTIGPKTASELVNHFGSLHEVLDRVEEIPQDKRRETLKTHRDLAILSWDLVGLKYDIEVDVDNIAVSPPDVMQLSNFISEYGFKSLVGRIEKLHKITIVSDLYQTSKAEVEVEAKQVLIDSKLQGVLGIILQTDIITIFSPSGFSSHIKITDNIDLLVEVFCDDSVKKITINYKELLHYFISLTDISKFKVFEDLSLMHYAASAGKREKIDNTYFLESGRTLFTLYDDLKKLLYSNKALWLYYEIDMPLCYILHDMEHIGMIVNPKTLSSLSADFSALILNLEKEIYTLSGIEFNISSPKQLAEILFDHLKLPKPKMLSKSQTYSTDAETLEWLSESGYKIADYLLKWRQLSKLKNTYTDALLRQINEKTGRVHTTFIQNATATGRLSSNEPNLQNIPTRSAEGQKIREAFVAQEDCILVAADYSQIELRILSDLANITTMQEAFKQGLDIHSITASQVFGVDIKNITAELRRKAKAINFGIIYGISAFGLAKQLAVTKDQAAQYISAYFKQYPGIEFYMESCKSFAKEHGYISNLFGRKCFIPSINDKNYSLRNFAERAAINAPIQGSASDIVKIAMIRLFRILKSKNFKAKMLLQVHDELIFEVPSGEVSELLPIIRNVMENIIPLKSKLLVDIELGSNWSLMTKE